MQTLFSDFNVPNYNFDMSYCGPPISPDQAWFSWNFDPILITAIGLLAFTGFYKSRGNARAINILSLTVIVSVLLFVSPLCALTVSLFSARTLHHIILTLVLAPLITLYFSIQSMNNKVLRDLAPKILMPALALHIVVFWFWHIPEAYQSSFSGAGAYWILQLTMLSSAVLFWYCVLKVGFAVGNISALLLSSIQMGALGAILTFAQSELYPIHSQTSLMYGITALTDQQLAGILMWVPAALPQVALALWICAKLLSPRLTRAGE